MIISLKKTYVLPMALVFSFLLFSCGIHSKKHSVGEPIKANVLNEKEKAKIDLTVLNYEKLKTVKKAIQENSVHYKLAYNELIKDANEALIEGPFSVTNKTQTPPSGDKHDYLSIGIYWWPDSTQPDGLPWIVKDGQVNPITSGDNLDLDRKGKMFSNTYSLGLAYFFSGEKKYAKKATELLKVWFLNPETKMNPNLNYAQGVPGKALGRGIGIIEFLGVTDIITSIELLESNNALDKETIEGLRLWFKEYLYWLQHNQNGIDESNAKNNHGTWYDVQVVSIMMFLDRTEEAKIVLESVKKNRIESQIEKDGKQPRELARTKTLHYSIYNLQAFTYLAYFGSKLKVDLWNYQPANAGGIKDAYSFLYPYAKEEKKWTLPELSNEHELKENLKELFLMAGSMFNIIEYTEFDKNLNENKSLSVLTYSF
jgi:hypothetical protein